MNTLISLQTKDTVVYDEGKPYEFRESDLQVYAGACRAIMQVVSQEKPDVYFCPVRGAYPPSRIILPQVQPNVGKVAFVTSSGFLLNRRDIIRSALEKIVEAGSEGSKILITDTVITGSSIRDLRRILKEDLPSIMLQKGINKLNIVFAKLWQGKSFTKNYAGQSSSHDESTGTSLAFTDYNFGVNDLFCEDDPNLLGIDYLDYAGDGKKHSTLYMIDSRRGIIVVDHLGRKKKYGGKPDCDIFVDLIANWDFNQHRSLDCWPL